MPCFYVRSANVTSLVQAAGTGTYVVGSGDDRVSDPSNLDRDRGVEQARDAVHRQLLSPMRSFLLQPAEHHAGLRQRKGYEDANGVERDQRVGGRAAEDDGGDQRGELWTPQFRINGFSPRSIGLPGCGRVIRAR